MNNYANETKKKKKIKKIVIINYKHNKHFNNTSLRNIDKNFDKNNSILFPEIKKDILKKKQRNKNNIYNSKKIISKSNIIPEIKQNNICSIITSSLNIIDNSTISRNVNRSRNNQSSFHKSYNTSNESSLNNKTYLSNRINFNKIINKSCIGFNDNNKENNNSLNNRKKYKNKTQSVIFKKNSINNLPNINNDLSKSFLKKKKIPVKKIYEYYIKKESENIIKPIKNFDNFIKRKYRDPKKRFNKIYCINKSYIKRTKELKNNREIALKDDFDINEYQNAIMLFLENRVDSINLNSLGQNYREFNDKINKRFSPKGRFTNLANKIRNHAPIYLINKLRDLDKNKLIKRAKYLKSNIDIDKKPENKKENYFEEFEMYLENKNIKENIEK